ncbi:MAG: sigma 54-interacting transcriptional regulator [Deltaproteobacteria bacterium]|nr:sigma 54-interacting transcriptional regulator [Deltaproteobacteria bacterium]
MQKNAMEPRLFVLSGPLEGHTAIIDAEEFFIGRHASNSLALRDVAVSRRHAVIASHGDALTLRDLNSRHGVSVNSRPVQEHSLTHGDLVAICGTTLLLLTQDTELPGGDASIRFDDTAMLADSTIALEVPDGPAARWQGVVETLTKGSESAAQLSVLLRAGSELGSFENLDALAEHLLRLALEAVPAQRAALLLSLAEPSSFDPIFVRYREQLDPAAAPSAATSPDAAPLSRTAALRVLHHKKALLSNDVRRTEGLEAAASLKAARVGSLLCTPLLVSSHGNGFTASLEQQPARALGVLYLDDRRDGYCFSEGDLRLMTAFAGMAAPAVANLQNLVWTEGERRRLQAEKLDHDLVGESPAMATALDLMARVARTASTVLLRGESGTGKELAAQAIHRGSSRRDRPFVAINCASLSDTLLESELFGHEKGAFTGAVARKLGKLEIAATGTVFLDEVGELPAQLQARLLRVLQERMFERVGGTRLLRADVRVIAATNRDLEAAMANGSFRRDLFFRLNVITITLPPLRERLSDVPLLVRHLAALHADRLGRPIPQFSPDARQLLGGYSWPGNVRELSNAVERALVLSPEEIIRPEDLPETLLEISPPEKKTDNGFHEAVREHKKQLILAAIEEADGRIVKAAKALDLHPNYLHRLIRNLDLRAQLP